MKKVLIISSSPRRRGNSDTLCDEFKKGAEESGNTVEKLFLADKKIGYCKGCETCSSLGKPCPQKDDAAEIIEKMILSDVIVLATPAYFYTMSAQLKTLIDRCCGDYEKISGKQFYFIITAADTDEKNVEMVVSSLNAFLYCLDGAELKGIVMGLGVWHAGEIKGSDALKKAYLAGKNL